MVETEPRRWRIAKNFKEARAKTTPRLSQAQIAQRVAAVGLDHFTERHASRLELGYMDATTAEVKAIARVLEVSPDWLCGANAVATLISPVLGAGLARAATVAPPALLGGASPLGTATAVMTAAAAAVTAVTEPRWPVCPGLEAIERASEDAGPYRLRLVELRADANRMLHTSGLPAANWRQWRELERQIGERLRQL